LTAIKLLHRLSWPDKKKAPVKGPISLAVVMVVVMMVMCTGGGRCDNGQGEQSCEDVGE
jgi:hypothetical protein